MEEELLRTADIEKSKNLWNIIKTETERSRKRLTERKDKKVTRRREEKQRDGDYDADLIDLNIDIENSKKSLKEFRERNGGKHEGKGIVTGKEFKKRTIK